MSNSETGRPLVEDTVSQKPHSYTYGQNRAYNAEDDLNGLPVRFWIESLGICYANKAITTEKTEYTQDYVNKQTILMSRAVARYTRGLIWVGMIAACVSIFQWLEIHNGSSDTHTLAVSAQNQAAAAAFNADIARKNLIASERAWIGPDNASITQLQAGKPMLATITYKNTGKEPAPVAIVVQPRVYDESQWGRFLGANEDILVSKSNCMDNLAYDGFIAFPNTAIGSNYTSSVDSQQDPTIQKFNVDNAMINGNKVIALTGCMTYKSQDTVRHTAFCFFYKAKFTLSIANLNICQLGWDAN